MGADYERYTAGTVMLETAERLVVEDKEPALQQFLLLVGALRAMCDAGRPPAQVLDAFLLRSLAGRRLRPVVRGVRALRRWRARTGRSARRPAACSARPAGCPARRTRSAETVVLLGALLAGDWDGDRGQRAAAPQGGDQAGRGVPAWHLERGLKSLAHVQR